MVARATIAVPRVRAGVPAGFAIALARVRVCVVAPSTVGLLFIPMLLLVAHLGDIDRSAGDKETPERVHQLLCTNRNTTILNKCFELCSRLQ